MKNKILIIINSELYIRNYLNTNIFKNLQDDFNVGYIANYKIKNKSYLKNLKNFSGFFKISEKQSIKENRIRNVLMWRYKYLSKSFVYRIKWFSEIKFYELLENKSLNELKKKIKRSISVLKFNLYIRVFGSNLIFPFYKFLYIDKDKVSLSLKKKILNFNPDLIIFPTASQSKVDNDILKICKLRRIKTLYLIDNWDNLSDKSVMIDKPDHIAVWGQQSKEHAIKIQKINFNSITNIGTPRFELYFNNRKKVLKSHFKFKYILFLGTALEFDESKIISKIDQILNKKPFSNYKVKLVYRPHPWRMSKNIINLKKYNNIIIDPQISKNYYKAKQDLSFQPDLNYYPNLIKNSEFVIGGLTSMMIESLIMYKKYLITAFPEKNFNNQFNSLNFHTHFKELYKVKNIIINTSVDELEKKMLFMWKNKLVKEKSLADIQRNYFVYNDKFSFADRLSRLVFKLLL